MQLLLFLELGKKKRYYANSRKITDSSIISVQNLQYEFYIFPHVVSFLSPESHKIDSSLKKHYLLVSDMKIKLSKS